MAAPVCTVATAGGASGNCPLGCDQSGQSASLRAALRRRELLSLLHRRFPEPKPTLVLRGGLRPRGQGRAAARAAALTTTEPARYFQRTQEALGTRYRLERTVAASSEQVLFEAYDQLLKRRVSLRVNFYDDPAIRTWFLREAEALSRLDHPAIRHVY